MIVVTTPDGDRDYEDATRYSTDELGNLCIWSGRQGDQLTALFHASWWREVNVDGSS